MTWSYVIRRFLMFLLIVYLGTSLIFFLPKLAPGRDPVAERLGMLASQGGIDASEIDAMVEAYRAKFGLDKPLWQQYLSFMGDILRFDFGYSLALYPTRVLTLIGQALPWTISLLLVSILLSFSIGSLLGGLLGWPRTPRAFGIAVSPFLLMSTIPYYLLGLCLIYFFAFRLKLFPLGGGAKYGVVATPTLEYALDVLHHSVLPALSIVLAGIGSWALGMRGMMITTLGEDYITLAQARGLPAKRIFYGYAIRNALLPQTTALALASGSIVSGSLLVEAIFRYPGIGSVLFKAISGFDYFVIYGVVFFIIVTIGLATLAIDLLYPLLDPRIRYRRG
jgi:peptide/nickel transport system permease protein